MAEDAEPAAELDAPAPRGLLTWKGLAYTVPFAVVYLLEALIIKLIQASHADAGGFGTVLQAWTPDIAFALGAAIVFGVPLSWLGRRGRMAVASLLALFMLLTFAALSFGHGYFMATGANLSWSSIEYWLLHMKDASSVVSSEVTAARFAFLLSQILVVAALVVLPHLRASRRRLHPRGALRRKLAYGVIGGAALGVLLFTAIPPPEGKAVAISRCVMWDILGDLAHEALSGDGEDAESVGMATAPIDEVEVEVRDGVERPNIVFFLFESLTWKSSGFYGETHDAAPFLASLGDKGVLIEHYYVVVPHTTKAVVSVLCGFPPYLDTKPKEAQPGILPPRCGPHVLSKVGYDTAFFQPATNFEKRDQLVANMGFETYRGHDDMPTEGFEKTNYFGREERMMLAPSLEWVDKPRDGPFFLTYLTLSTHHNYVTPQSFPHVDFKVDDPDYNNYLNAVRYIDGFLRDVYAGFEERGLLDKTVFVIVGDHGEAFAEHGRRQHDLVMWDEGVRTGAILVGPERFIGPPRRISGVRSALDVVPTLLELAGLKAAEGELLGRSLLAEAVQGRELLSSCWFKRRCLALRQGPIKTIYHYGLRPMEVYDTFADPHEKNDLANQPPHDEDALEARKERMLGWVRETQGRYKRWEQELARGVVSSEQPPLGEQLFARIGDHVEVLGFSAKPGVVHAGQDVTLRYVFRVLKTPKASLKLFVHVNHPNGWVNADHVPAKGAYPLHKWKPGEYVVDEHRVHIPGTWRSGVARIHLGLWDQPRDQRLPIHDATVRVVDGKLNVGQVGIVGAPVKKKVTVEERRRKAAQWIGFQPPEGLGEELEVVFGDRIELLAVRRERMSVKLAGTVQMTYVFRSLGGIPKNWKLTVELTRHGGGSIEADHVPIGGLYPPSDWREGEFVVDRHRIHIDMHQSKPGTYDAWLGFQQGKMPVPVATKERVDRYSRVWIGQVIISPGAD